MITYIDSFFFTLVFAAKHGSYKISSGYIPNHSIHNRKIYDDSMYNKTRPCIKICKIKPMKEYEHKENAYKTIITIE